MVNKRNWLGMLAIALVFGMMLVGCASTAVELDENILNTMENASWEVKALVYSPYLFYNNNFIELTKDEVSYFYNLSLTKELESYKYHALTAPEFPDTYYYVRKTDGRSLERLLGNPFFLTIYKSTTIDEETWVYRNSLRSVSWEVKVLPDKPSLDGFEERRLDGNEDERFVSNVMSSTEPGKNVPPSTWCEISSSKMPNITYYYYTGARGSFIQIGNSAMAYMKKMSR